MNDILELIYAYESAKMKNYNKMEFIYEYVYDFYGFDDYDIAKPVIESICKTLKDYERSKMMKISKTNFAKIKGAL